MLVPRNGTHKRKYNSRLKQRRVALIRQSGIVSVPPSANKYVQAGKCLHLQSIPGPPENKRPIDPEAEWHPYRATYPRQAAYGGRAEAALQEAFLLRGRHLQRHP